MVADRSAAQRHQHIGAHVLSLGEACGQCGRVVSDNAKVERLAARRRDNAGNGEGVGGDDLRRATDIIADVTGTVPRLFRPPYGVLSTSALLTARELGLMPVLWGSWGREWARGATAESVYSVLTRDLCGGGTVLLHDSDCTSRPGSAQAALAALPMLLDECERRGLRVGTLGENGLR